MPGLEAAAAVSGLIGLTITVIQGSIQIYDAVKDKSGIPEKLRKVSDTLPSLVELLKGAQSNSDKDQPPKQAWIAVENDVQRCHAACQELYGILESAYPKADAGTVGRVFKNMGNLVSRKGKTAEQLLKEIHGYLEILRQRQIITNAALLDDIKRTVDGLFPSPGQTLNNVSGTNIGHNTGQVNNQNGGSGQQFNGPGGTYNINNYPSEHHEESLREKLREWLRFPSIDDRRTAITKAHRDTFRWVLSPAPPTEDARTPGSDFVQWLRSGSEVFWIQGKMGCGKSTLMKYVTEDELTEKHLLEWANGQTLHYPSYYFSKTGTSELQKSLQGLYRTLLATLIQHEKGLFRVAFPDWQSSDSSHEPTAAVLRDALEKILTKSDITCKYCFFIDGLDEYQETNDGLRGKLADDILGLARLSAVKLVVSSRPEPIFKLNFAHCPTLELHRFTRDDIAAYVDAEVRQKAVPHDLTPTETDQLNFLCDEVIRKAQGVFLWVAIAVASILNGIADYETLPELVSKLGQLDPKLTVLFKQVLTERVKASHRENVARSLLTEGRYDFDVLNFYAESQAHPDKLSGRDFHRFLQHTHAMVQAISPYVDASHDYNLLFDIRNITMNLPGPRRRLPGRSCGFYHSRSVAGTSTCALEPADLSHSTLVEFLEEDETQMLLLEQAGDDFQLDKAIAVGRMADLVYRVHSEANLDRVIIGKALIGIIRNVEMAEVSTGITQTKLISDFEKLLGRDFKSCTPALANSHCNSEGSHSDCPFLRPQGITCHGSDLLSWTISSGFSCYLKHKINTGRGVPFKTGTPLLFYALRREEGGHTYDSDKIFHAKPIKLLLAAGADPNERDNGFTPWSVVLHRLHFPRESNASMYRLESSRYGIILPKSSLDNTLDVAKSMLEHGADPFLRMKTEDYAISPQIFAELLERECCSGSTLDDCLCAYARQIQPQLTELVELVRWRRYFRQQMRTEGELLVRGAWLVMVLSYVLQSMLTWSSS